jgi:2-dehydro-3-deoxyphosphogalactonate aldolase
VAIIRGVLPAEAEAIAGALYEGGIRIIEVPLNSPEPLRSIELLAAAHPDALIGAGTVLTPAAVREVHAAGARLVVAPNLDLAVLRQAVELGMVALPGVLSASEAFAALAAGAAGLKLFPAEMVPPAAVKALRAVLDPATVVLPVGGISLDNMRAYRDAGASGFGIGSSLYKPGRDAQAVGAAGRRWADAWRAPATAASVAAS